MSDAPYKEHGTHLPVLEGALAILPKPIYALELGAGEYSTPWFVQETYGKPGSSGALHTVEPLVEWRPRGNHSHYVEPEWWPIRHRMGPDSDELTWSIALVDHAVGLRKEAVELLRGNCHCIVVHDTQLRDYSIYGWGDGTLRARESEIVLHVEDKWHGIWTTAIFNTAGLPDDGKSTPITDLALKLAEQGHRVAWDVKGAPPVVDGWRAFTTGGKS